MTRSRMDAANYFSRDYVAARERFLDAARRAGARLHTLTLSARGPSGETLAIDIACVGAEQPERVFMHTSGVHGVEAYTGSATQLALLGDPPVPGARDALVLVHVLNPYGMAWLRRANEQNVDLNRNFLVRDEAYAGSPELYGVLDPFLNPPSPPRRDAYTLRALALVLRHGMHRVKQAVAQGQYDYPRGLFFGGAALQEGPALFLAWLRTHLARAEYLFAFDMHTGLGRHGRDIVAPEPNVGVTPLPVLETALARRRGDLARPAIAYTVRGAMGASLPAVLPQARVDFLIQEIGTRPPLAVLHALREENRWHFHGDGSLDHPAKQRLLDALCPPAPEWRRKAVSLGVAAAGAAARWVFRER